MFTIEKNVPVPERTYPGSKNGGRPGKFPWKEMQPGDSFFAPGYSLVTGKTRGDGLKYMSLSGVKEANRDFKWTARTVTENGVVGVRVWRVA